MTNSSVWESVATAQTRGIAGVADFAAESRLHISVNVRDLRQAVDFYRVFFGVNPVKVKQGYAKFDLNEPPLNFSLNAFPDNTRAQGHFGVQLNNTRFIREAHERFGAAGFHLIEEESVECCYAVQTKFWVADPDGNRWELFVTTEPESDEGCGPECICHQEFDRSYAIAD
ncbi:MAG: ArsI/CadI family heavy metal resistance metalloenzyme [Aquisalimonadaceae bacterium]